MDVSGERQNRITDENAPIGAFNHPVFVTQSWSCMGGWVRSAFLLRERSAPST
jgi:hypothetical protein